LQLEGLICSRSNLLVPIDSVRLLLPGRNNNIDLF
jgi:hypothetical protein